MLKTALFLFLLTLSVYSRATLPPVNIHALGYPACSKSGLWSDAFSLENRVATSGFLRLRGGSDEEGKETKADSGDAAETADGAETQDAVDQDEKEGPMDLNKALKQVPITK